MKIRFFGDSWLWSWFYKINSSTIKRKLRTQEGLPIFEIYLRYLGIDIDYHNSPGNDFDRTVETILTTNKHDDIKYNVVFFSSLLRRNSRLLETTKNYKQLISSWNEYVIGHLNNINQWAEQNNQEVFLIGGQSTLFKNLFDQASNKTRIHLLSECIVSELQHRPKTHGIFKLAGDIVDKIDESWDKELVNHIYDDTKNWDFDSGKLSITYPDTGHLNPSGAFLVLDKIMTTIEQLERKNKK